MKKIFCILLAVCILISVSVFSASAVSYTEYYQYSGTAISTTNSAVLSGYAVNVLRDDTNDYDTWFSVRVGQYQYLLCVFKLTEDFNFDNLPSDGSYFIYDERMYNYQEGNQTRYQVGFSQVTGSVSLSLNRKYLIGNCQGCVGVNASDEAVYEMRYVEYILYTVIVFLLLWVAFKFINKRWLLP